MTTGGSCELLCRWGLQEGQRRPCTGTPSQDGVLAVAAWPQCQLGMWLDPRGSHSPRYTLEKGLELCGSIRVLVSAVLPGQTPGLGAPPWHGQAVSALTFLWI